MTDERPAPGSMPAAAAKGAASSRGESFVVGFPGPSSAAVGEERRRYLRAPKVIDIDLRHKDEPVRASMVNLSEGGLRCTVPSVREIEPQDVVGARVHLDDAHLEVRGQVSWVNPGKRGTDIGISFTGLEERDAQRIRSHVFALQLQEQRAERTRRAHRDNPHQDHHHHHGR